MTNQTLPTAVADWQREALERLDTADPLVKLRIAEQAQAVAQAAADILTLATARDVSQRALAVARLANRGDQ